VGHLRLDVGDWRPAPQFIAVSTIRLVIWRQAVVADSAETRRVNSIEAVGDLLSSTSLSAGRCPASRRAEARSGFTKALRSSVFTSPRPSSKALATVTEAGPSAEMPTPAG